MRGDGRLLRVPVAGFLAVVVASSLTLLPTPAQAASRPFPPDLALVLAPPPTGFARESAEDATLQVGRLDSDAIANMHDDPGLWKPILLASQFTRGFASGWRTIDGRSELLESIYAFKSSRGASLYWNEDEAYDETSLSAADRLDDPEIDYSYGGRYVAGDSTRAWIEFVKGNLVLLVMVDVPSGNATSILFHQVAVQYYIAPSTTVESWSNPLPVTQIIGVLIACIVLCIGIGFLVLKAATRRAPINYAVPPGATMSPDGLWWYDGHAWVPIWRSP